jgi:putative Mg2+ transporter-C (MgtC) family protein
VSSHGPTGAALEVLAHLVVALLLGLPVAWDRKESQRTVGLRTFPLVAMASCGFVLVGRTVLDPAGHAHVLQGLMTGIGFIGGGAILKTSQSVRGTATAAGIWATALVGCAVGYDAYALAAMVSVLDFLILCLLGSRSRLREGAPADPSSRETPGRSP